LQRIRYKFPLNGVREHFIGINKSTTDQGEVIPFLNPAWVTYHFHEKCVAAVKEYASTCNEFVDVPVGSGREGFLDEPDPPIRAIVTEIHIHYEQESKDYCMFYSFASALWYLGFCFESELVRIDSHSMEFGDKTSQVTRLRETLSGLDLFQDPPIVWGQKGRKYLRFDVLNDISSEPTMLIPWGGDGGVQHAVTVVGHYIFDSTTGYALHLTQESLDWCCNTRLGYQRAYFAIRFPIHPERK